MSGGRLGWLALLLLAAGLAIVGGLAVGPVAIPLSEVGRAVLGHGPPGTRTIVVELRLPRALLAALVGAALSLAGAAFQALLRNPLAEPYLLGVSGGAAFGAVVALALGLQAAGAWALPGIAFLGAVGAIVVVLYIAARAGLGLDTRVLLLAGVVVGAFFNAVILLLLTFVEAEAFRSAVFWMMGSLSGADWPSVAVLTAVLLPAGAALVGLSRALDLLAVGEETALYLGTPVEAVKWGVYLLASLLVAASVAVSGAIGFVGLIVPHAVRLLWGSAHRFLLPASVFLGAAFLAVADAVARTVAAPTEIPVGVVTALVGVPLFLFLLVGGPSAPREPSP